MDKLDSFDYWLTYRENRKARLADTEVADNAEVRKKLLEKVKNGESTLEEVQEELKKIKLNAKANGNETLYDN